MATMMLSVGQVWNKIERPHYRGSFVYISM